MSERGDLTAENKAAMRAEGRFAMTGEEYARGRGSIHFLPAPQAQPQGHVHPRYAELHAKMRAISEAKNSDYADSDTDPLRNFRACERAGIPAFDGCLTRLSDKFERIMNLRRKEREDRTVGVRDESITDTLLDLANYALIAIVLHEEMRDPAPTLTVEEVALVDPALLKATVRATIAEEVEMGRMDQEVLDAFDRSCGPGPEEMGG